MSRNKPANPVIDPEAERRRRQAAIREQVLERLWEIAHISPETTRGSITGQVKAISMIVAIEGLIPDRRAGSKVPAIPAVPPQIYQAEWLRNPNAEPSAAEQEHSEPVSPQAMPSPEPQQPSPEHATPQAEAGGSLPEAGSSPNPSRVTDARGSFMHMNPFTRRR